MSKPETTPAPDPEDEFYGGIWWVRVAPDCGLRSASPGECAAEIKRLRAALMEVVKATDAGAYFTARRAAGLAIGVTDG